MKPILAFLQNQWFHDPESVQRMYDRHPEDRNRLIAGFLFMGCLTGRRLQAVLGEQLCDHIIWEETSKNLGSHAGSRFPADLAHMRDAIAKFNPAIIICFGKIAGDAMAQINQPLFGQSSYTLITAPHPAARQNPIPALKEAAAKLKQLASQDGV